MADSERSCATRFSTLRRWYFCQLYGCITGPNCEAGKNSVKPELMLALAVGRGVSVFLKETAYHNGATLSIFKDAIHVHVVE